jgi:titin
VAINDVNQQTLTQQCNADGFTASRAFLFFNVRAVNANGSGPYSETMSWRCSQQPEAPAQPQLVSSSPTQITISFAVPDLHSALHTQTKIFWDNGSGGPFTTYTLNDISQRQFTRSGLSAGLTYRIKVAVVSEAGESPESAILTTLAASVPGAPVASMLSTTNTQITIQYTAPTSTGGSPLTGYAYYYSANGIDYPDLVSPTGTVSSPTTYQFTWTCAGSQVNFWLRVVAVNAVGYGAYSDAVVTRCSNVPETPDPPGLVTSDNNSVTVSFAPKNLYNAVLAGYRLWRDDGNGGPYVSVDISDTTAVQYQFTGLLSGLPYRFKSQVATEVGYSAESNPATLYSAKKAAVIDSMYVSSSSDTVINLAWTIGASYDNGGAAVTQWNVYGSVDRVTWPALSSPHYTTADGVTLTLQVLCTDQTKWVESKSGKYLYFKVAAVTAAGVGEVSDSKRFRCAPRPNGPLNPTRIDSTLTSITIGIAHNGLNNAIQLGFRIFYDDGLGGDFTSVVLSDTSATQYTISNLVTARAYRIKFAVITEVGESDASGVVTFTAGAKASAPVAPTYISSQNNNEFTVTWGTVSDSGGVPVTNWYVYAAHTLGDWPEEANPTANVQVTTFQATIDCTNIIGVDRSQKDVYVRVAAKTAAAVGTMSPSVKFFCANAPAAPTVVEDAANSNTTQITLNWTENDLYRAEMLEYKVYANDGLGGAVALIATITDSSQRYYTHTGLTGNLPYKYKVSVVSSVGEGTLSNEFTAHSCGNPTVTNVIPTAVTTGATVNDFTTGTQIVLAWPAPSTDGGCSVTGYRLFYGALLNGAYTDIVPGDYDDNAQPDNPLDTNLNPSLLTGKKTGLTPSQQYDFYIKVFTRKGAFSGPETRVKAAGIPAAMTNRPDQDVANSSPTQIALTWTVPDMRGGDAIGYEVFKNAGGSTSIDYATADATCGMETNPAPQSCTVTGLSSGLVYQMRARAINDIGQGELSPMGEYTAATVPATMAAPVISATTRVPVVTLTWTAPADQGSVVYNYEIEVEKVTDGTTGTKNLGGTAVVPVTATTADLNSGSGVGLLVKFQYRYRIRAENGLGLSTYSPYTSTTDGMGFCVGPPDTPPNLARHADTPTNTAIKLGWTALGSDAEVGGDDVGNAQYEVYGDQVDGAQNNLVATTANNYYEHTGLTATQTWYYTIKAKNNGAFRSDPTPVLTAVVAALSDAPANLVLTSSSAGNVNMNWNPPASNGGAVIEKYQVRRSDNPSVYVDVVNTQLTYAWTGQSEGALISYYVRAVTSVGNGPESTAAVTVST